jgi:hypothetical protein
MGGLGVCWVKLFPQRDVEANFDDVVVQESLESFCRWHNGRHTGLCTVGSRGQPDQNELVDDNETSALISGQRVGTDVVNDALQQALEMGFVACMGNIVLSPQNHHESGRVAVPKTHVQKRGGTVGWR